MLYTNHPTTTLQAHLQDISQYHVWAITRLTDWLKAKPAALLEAEADSSFPGIKATLLHIWDVERQWMAHMQQRPVPDSMRTDFDGSLLEVLEGIVEHAASFCDYVESLSEEELEEECCCNVMFVGEICRPRFEIIQHCLNHSTYHRGQIVSIGHQVGLKDAPMTDYMYYVLRVREGSFADASARNRWRRDKASHFVHENLLAVNFFSR